MGADAGGALRVLALPPGPASSASWPAAAASRAWAGFDLHAFGAALTVGIALITQMGEQADYLRFMPPSAPPNPPLVGWGAGGWPWLGAAGVVKMLGGALLAYLAIATRSHPAGGGPNRCTSSPTGASPQFGLAVAATALFVVISQLKINVTNAYAGSLAWSNFFAGSRTATRGGGWWCSTPLIALMLMELDVFQALGKVLGLYANVAIAGCGGGGRSGHQQAPGPVAAGHRVQAGAPLRRQPGGRGRDGGGLLLSVAAWAASFGPMNSPGLRRRSSRWLPPSWPRR